MRTDQLPRGVEPHLTSLSSLINQVKHIRCPAISTYEGHHEMEQVSRKYRLNRVLGFLMARFNCTIDVLASKYGLLALHDHKGTLTCCWQSSSKCVAGIKHVEAAWFSEGETQLVALMFCENGTIDTPEQFFCIN